MLFSIHSSNFLRALTGAILALSLFAFSGCQTTSNAPTTEPSEAAASPTVLRVGVSANMPPFVFEQGGKLVGLEVDFARALADELGRNVRFVKMSWEDLIPSLRKGKIDIVMSGMNYNPERAAIISFSNPYVKSGQKAMVLQKNASKYPVAGFIVNAKIKVGAEKATTGSYLVRSSFPKAELKTYSSAQRGAEAVINGEIELFIHDAPTVYWMSGLYQNQGLTAALPVLTQDLMAWGINRDNVELLDAVNQVLVNWSADGTTDAILNRWVRL
tara:strand:- start:7129 stop:7944 length:816 start_codon:yes stop_codon:yes gene_type:complete